MPRQPGRTPRAASCRAAFVCFSARAASLCGARATVLSPHVPWTETVRRRTPLGASAPAPRARWQRRAFAGTVPLLDTLVVPTPGTPGCGATPRLAGRAGQTLLLVPPPLAWCSPLARRGLRVWCPPGQEFWCFTHDWRHCPPPACPRWGSQSCGCILPAARSRCPGPARPCHACAGHRAPSPGPGSGAL